MRWLLVVVCMAGCTQVLGLDESRDDDRDGDHIPDGSDNCPDVANPDQSRHDLSDPRGDACRVCVASDPTDSDGDGIPDECDGCDNRLPDGNHNGIPDACENPHDEDRDGVPDLVDNCPSVANADQADTHDVSADGGTGLMPDGVGDACDDTVGRDGQFFDSFVERNQLWLTNGVWQDGNDHTIVDLSPAIPTRIAGLGLGTFTASAAVSVMGAGSAGIIAVEAGGEQYHIACGIFVSGGHSYLTLSAANYIGGIPAPNAVELTPRTSGIVKLMIAAGPTYGQAVTCSVDADSNSVVLSTTNTVWHPGLSTVADVNATMPTGTAQFDFYDVVTNAP